MGSRPGPFTSSFENSGKLTSYWVLQKLEISASLPGSCSPN